MGEQKSNSLYGQVLKQSAIMLEWTKKKTASTKYAVLPVTDEESQAVEQPAKNLDDNLDEAKEHTNQRQTCWQTMIGWACMVMAILSGASIGPVFKYMMSEGVPVMLASSWRNQTMVLSLIPMAVYEAYSKKENRVDWFAYKPDLPYPVCVHVMISGVSWAINLLCWVVGLQYVSTFKASVVASCHPVLLVIAMRFTGHSVSLPEWIGVFVAFGGMFVSEYKPSSSSSSSSESPPGDAIDEVPFKLQMFGYLMCLLAAAGEVVTILNRIKTRKYVPLLQYTLTTSFFVMICATGLSMYQEGVQLFQEDGTICLEQNCVFGWTAPKWRVRMMLFGLIIGALCITGFNYAMSYIPPLVFAAVTLVDPAVTALISFVCGIESLPGLFSWIGGAVVMAGVGVIGYGDAKRTAAEEAADNNHKTLDDTDDSEGSVELSKMHVLDANTRWRREDGGEYGLDEDEQ